ncbi:MAG: hypothetical protein JST20_09730 [Bacteroidetes bacterium]|nr:hypothetical protein [Bacteroidota bacterium]
MFKPRDEMALRHFFTKHAEEILRIEYFGPIIDENDNIPHKSPDCFILDKRKTKHKLLRCEFKGESSIQSLGFIEAFRENGKFDIAIVWEIGRNNKVIICKKMKELYGCSEIIELNKTFNNVIEYRYANIKSLLPTQNNNTTNKLLLPISSKNIENNSKSMEDRYAKLTKELKDRIFNRLKSKEDSQEFHELKIRLNITALYICTLLSPKKIEWQSLKDYLNELDVKKLSKPKGNNITAIEQLIKKYDVLKFHFDKQGYPNQNYRYWDENVINANSMTKWLKKNYQDRYGDVRLPTLSIIEKKIKLL